MKRLAIFLLCVGYSVVHAAQEDISFTGTLVEPPVCTISNGNTIEVQFIDVIIDNIDGNNYLKDVPYDIVCDPDVTNDAWVMTLTWTGTQTSYNDAALQTDITGLGIELRQSGQAFKLNTPLNVTPGNPPKLKAVPVKASDATLADGNFSAYATLQVDYQ